MNIPIRLSRGLCTALMIASLFPSVAIGQDTGIAKAPPNTDVLETTFEGTYFVRRALKQRFDRLLARVASLEGRVRSGELKAGEARAELDELRSELRKVKQLVEQEKVLVSPFQIHSQSEEGTFELGAERLLVVTCDQLRVVGWDQPHVKYVLRKIVLSAGGPVKDDLEGIVLEHKHGQAPDLVGRTAEQRQADEQKFLKSPVGLKLTPEQQANRAARFLKGKARTYRNYLQFLGRDVDTLKLVGLVHREGNRQINYELRRPGGGQAGSRWRRHAELTLFVPKCTAILLRGCQVGLDVSGVEGHLILTSSGSRDRDYNGKFSIRGIDGPLTLDNVPIDIIEDVQGDVLIESTTEMVNTGTNHSGEFRTLYSPAARRCSITNVDGNLTAHFVRSDLHLDHISGIVNVQNEYGDTDFSVVAEPADGAHRIVSHSGLVRVVLTPGVKPAIALFLATNCGTVRTTFRRNELEDLSVSHASEHDSKRRNWRVFHSPVGNDFAARLQLYGRADEAILDAERSAGLDLISRAGRVELLRRAE